MKRWQLIAMGAVGGAMTVGVAGYACLHVLANLFGHSAYVSAASQGSLDVAVLRKLRVGDTAGAIATMERRLEGNEITLSEYVASNPASDRDPAVASAITVIAEYRSKYPSPLRSGSP